tara:strand:- start:86 stop:307 length:222 start_codon:yes stop_codon:yes gene_type:complete
MSTFKQGDKVEVSMDLSFKGLTGTIRWSTKDEDGSVQYMLTDITYPKMVDKNGVEYTMTKNYYYESWLKLINN